MDLWAAIADERRVLQDDLAQLTDEQWETQSLCAAWRVRDVVAHLTFAVDYGWGEATAGLVRAGFNFNKWNAEASRRRGSSPPPEILGRYRSITESRRHPPATRAIDVQCDTMIHGQDVRRPLGMTRAFPEERLVAALERMKRFGFPFGAKRRIAGLRLVATDFDWTTGSGPEVRGTAEALLLMMAGRRIVDAELSGEGVQALSTRA